MIKTSIALLFWLSTFAGMIIMMMSMGWMLALFGIVLLPVIILHIVSGKRAINRFPYLGAYLVATSLTFLCFALCRPDMDDANQYTGLSALRNFLNPQSSRYVHTMDYYFYIAILMLIATITIDIILLRKSKRPPPMYNNNEFV